MAEYIEKADVYKLFDGSSGIVALHVADIDQIPAADVAPVVHGELRVEVTTEGFLNAEVATQRGWYRKCYFCPSCNQQLKEEMYEKDSCFMSWCVVRDESPMHYCPNCGAHMKEET